MRRLWVWPSTGPPWCPYFSQRIFSLVKPATSIWWGVLRTLSDTTHSTLYMYCSLWTSYGPSGYHLAPTLSSVAPALSWWDQFQKTRISASLLVGEHVHKFVVLKFCFVFQLNFLLVYLSWSALWTYLRVSGTRRCVVDCPPSGDCWQECERQLPQLRA